MFNPQTTTTKAKYLYGTLIALMLAASLLLMASARPAHALTTFTVTTIGDEGDGNLGNGICDVELKATQCTLRAAIQEANFEPGADVIEFNIAGTGVHTIAPASELPAITEQVTIDGYSQPGSSTNTLAAGGDDAAIKIELSGRDAASDGLVIKASNVGVSGLAINRFASSGISIEGGLGAQIEGNFIGTDPTGTEDLGNNSAGVDINGALGSGANTIGGTEPAERNVISGNDSEGIFIFNGSVNNQVLGNLIGTKKDGKSALGNGTHGVDIASGTGNIVGGSARALANTIAFNGDRGVQVGFIGNNSTGNGILRNSIFSNGGPGIDLQADGPTANDPDDPDAGPNNLQNKPVLASARNASGKTTIKGTLNSTPSALFTVQFFSNPAGNEGKRFLGQKSVSTLGNGDVSFTFVPKQAVGVGQAITATATKNFTGDTSEFSAPRKVVKAS